MGWSTGSLLMSGIISDLKETLQHDPETRKEVYMILIDHFETYDCDTLEECLGKDAAFREAYHEINPNIEIDEDYEEDYDNEYIDDDFDDVEEE